MFSFLCNVEFYPLKEGGTFTMQEKNKHGNVKLSFRLSDEDRKTISAILNKGKMTARIFKRALILRQFDEGYTSPHIATSIGVTAVTVRTIGWNYVNHGLNRALYELPRPGGKGKLTEEQETHIVALICSDPPDGYDRWSVRLIVDEVIKRKSVNSIGRETIRMLLKNHNLKPWLHKMWCVPNLTDEYIERMEDLLSLYGNDYNPKEPVLCLDEKPVQLLEDLRKPKKSDSKDKPKKSDHQYRRKGVVNVFCAVEPKVGCYYNRVTENKKGPEFAKELERLAEFYPHADTIHLVMDNYSTHTKKQLVGYFGEEKGTKIWDRFTIHYTPKNASWLDQAEIAIGLYTRQCLGKSRVPDIESLRKRTQAWNEAINEKKVKIKWNFTIKKARKVFKY